MSKLTFCGSVVLALLLAAGGCSQQSDEPPRADVRFSDVASGENSKDVGDYVIHFNALTTEHLSPEVARTYGIVRSKNRVLLNVTVVRKVPGTTGEPVAATVTAKVTNLTGQLKTVEMREIVEGDREAVYYVGDLAVANDETLIFEIDVKPENETQTHYVKFKRQFSY